MRKKIELPSFGPGPVTPSQEAECERKWQEYLNQLKEDENFGVPEEDKAGFEEMLKKMESERQEDERRKRQELTAGNVPAGMIASVMDQIMRPMLESMSGMMQRMSEAVEHIATSQDVMRNRLEALEKQVRLDTPVTDRQAKYLTDAAKRRARELLDKRGVDDRKAVTKVAGIIRKSVLAKYGIGAMREVPRCEYSVAMNMMETWNEVLTVMDAVKEARERKEAEKHE